MLKLFKKWIIDWNDFNRELTELGLYFHCTSYGCWIQYIDPERDEKVNTVDDKSRHI